MCDTLTEQMLWDQDHESDVAKRLIEETIRDLKYKPGYRFAWQQRQDGNIELHLHTPPLPNAQASGVVTLDRMEFFPVESFQTKAAVEDRFIELIRGWEIHEMFEWIVFRGQQFRDPHIGEINL